MHTVPINVIADRLRSERKIYHYLEGHTVIENHWHESMQMWARQNLHPFYTTAYLGTARLAYLVLRPGECLAHKYKQYNV